MQKNKFWTLGNSWFDTYIIQTSTIIAYTRIK